MSKFNLVRSFRLGSGLGLGLFEHAIFKQCIRLPDGRFVALLRLYSMADKGPTAILFLDKSMKTVESFIPRYQITLESLLYYPAKHCILFTSLPSGSPGSLGLNLYCLDIQLHDHSGPPVLPKAGDDSDDIDTLSDDILPYFKKLEPSYGYNMTEDMRNVVSTCCARHLVLYPEDGSIWFTVSPRNNHIGHIFALSLDLNTIEFRFINPTEYIDSLLFLQDGRVVILENKGAESRKPQLRVFTKTTMNIIELSSPFCKTACALVSNKVLMVPALGIPYNDLYTIHCDEPYDKQELSPTEQTLTSIPRIDIDAVMQLPDSLDILATTPRQIHVFELEDVAKKRSWLQQTKRSRQSWKVGNADIPNDLSTVVDGFLTPPYTFDDEPHEQGGAGAASGAGGAEAKRMKLYKRLSHLELRM